MFSKSFQFAAAFLAGIVAVGAQAQTEPSHVRLGAEKPLDSIANIQIKNFEDESLGHITDLGIDLINGRIVEVLVSTQGPAGEGRKIVAVPPLALVPDRVSAVYRLNVTAEDFASAPNVDVSHWQDWGRTERVAATYHFFHQEPYFLEEGEKADPLAKRPKVNLGYVERSNRILNLPVGNLQNQPFGKVWSLTLDITRGRILNVIVLAPGNFKTKSVIPAMALSFNAARDTLLLDDSKLEFADEPRYVLTEAAFGQAAYSREESYQGPHTSVALEQGGSDRDVDRTLRINQQIRAAKLDRRHIQVGTLNGRVTLRGWVKTQADKDQMGAIAIAASRLELVDNQLTIGKPA